MTTKEKESGKVGHLCPECGDGKHPITPAPRSTVLHWSKKAPGLLECPNCGETFAPAAIAESPAPKKAKK